MHSVALNVLPNLIVDLSALLRCFNDVSVANIVLVDICVHHIPRRRRKKTKVSVFLTIETV